MTETQQKPVDYEPPERDDPAASRAYADDGTDLTLIRWMLSLSPEERLRALQSQAQFINQVRAENGLT